MTAAAQQTVAGSLQQAARHPADEEELAGAALVLTLQLTVDRHATVVVVAWMDDRRPASSASSGDAVCAVELVDVGNVVVVSVGSFSVVCVCVHVI